MSMAINQKKDYVVDAFLVTETGSSGAVRLIQQKDHSTDHWTAQEYDTTSMMSRRSNSTLRSDCAMVSVHDCLVRIVMYNWQECLSFCCGCLFESGGRTAMRDLSAASIWD